MKSHIPFLALAPVLAQSQDWGLPVPNPSKSFWQMPPHAEVADHESTVFPTMWGWHLLRGGDDDENAQAQSPLRIVMLEARQTCSGATGRNGGHLRPSSHVEHHDAKEITFVEDAAKMTVLRAKHVEAMIEAAALLPEEGRVASEARSMDSIDAYFDEDEWKTAREQWEVLRKEVPEVGNEWFAFEGEEARNISLLPDAVGILAGTPKVAGAMWPYRFVTHALGDLLKTYPSFSLDTHTPALKVSTSANGSQYVVLTPRGNITASHVVHATNAWSPHLVPSLRGVVAAGRLHMSVQLGGTNIPSAGAWPSYLERNNSNSNSNSNSSSDPGGRAYSFYRQHGLDYLVQQPSLPGGRGGELMFGGEGPVSPSRATEDHVAQPMLDDAAAPDHGSASYLAGALASYFGFQGWGAERADYVAAAGLEDGDLWAGRTKRVWTGIEGASVDSRPWVGRLPRRDGSDSVAGAEWVSAAYDGEGMCFAWLSGKALSGMLLDSHGKKEDAALALPEWFPESMVLTEERLAKARSLNVTKTIMRRRAGADIH
ncbi:hypothetical protein PspLS_00003 [Pyricularia sp. CBS 133598]|nr:hypothetical protein PspLS_00003 [Pyricularia sp. CBS 133598]